MLQAQPKSTSFSIPQLDPENFRNILQHSAITTGDYVAAGDRFETVRPGYQVVKDQMSVTNLELPVLSAGLSQDGRSVILQKPARKEALNYAIKLPINAKSGQTPQDNHQELPQQPSIDLLSDLTGIQTSWISTSGKQKWSGWLPHLDLEVARELISGSAEHSVLFGHLDSPGKLTLQTQLNLWQMLHPAVQPGVHLDYEYPPEIVTIVLKSKSPLMEGRWREHQTCK